MVSKYGLQSCWTDYFSLMSLIFCLRRILNYLCTKYVSKFWWWVVCFLNFFLVCFFVSFYFLFVCDFLKNKKYPRIKNFKASQSGWGLG